MNKIVKAVVAFSSSIVILFVLFLLIRAFFHGGLPKPQIPKSSITIDFESCYNGDFSDYNRVFYTPTSAIAYEIFGTVNSNTKICFFRYDQKDSKHKWINCRVPISLGITTFSVNENGADYSSINEYCGYEELFGESTKIYLNQSP